MLKALYRLCRGQMTELDAVQCQAVAVPCGAVVPESSLITSTTRKRKPDCNAHTSTKRQKAALPVDQGNICSSDVSHDDQENQQQPHVALAAADAEQAASQHGRQARNGFSMMLAPIYDWMQPGQQSVQQQRLDCAGLSAAVPVVLHAAEEASDSGGSTTGRDGSSPESGSTPAVSQPSTAATGQPPHECQQPQQQHSNVQQHSQQHHSHQQHQQFLQQEDQLYHPQQQQQGSSCEESDDVDYDEDDFDPFVFISTLGPVERYAQPGRQPLLPCQTRTCKQKTLVLDLDETLVHSTLDAAFSNGADFSFPVMFNGAEHMVHVRQRPHMQEFLERVATLFEVVVFTASQKVYAEKLLNILDPHRQLIRHRIYRDSCVLVDGNYLKDLSVLGRDLKRCAIVDNSPQAFGFQLANGIPIESWYDDPDDSELLQLLPFLEAIAHCDVTDVRPAISSRFNLAAKVREANMRLVYAAAAAAGHPNAHLMMTAAAVLQPQQQLAAHLQPHQLQHPQEQQA